MKVVKAIFSDKRATTFAQAFDVFHKSKVVMLPIIEVGVVDDFGDSHIEKIKEQCAEDNYDLVAIFDTFTTYYRNPDVNAVSTGQKWCALDEILPSTE